MNHRQVNPSFAGDGQGLVIFAQATTFAQPRKRPLDNPTFGQDLKAVKFTATGNLDLDPEQATDPIEQGWTVVTAVEQQQHPSGKERQAFQDQTSALFVRPIGRMNHDRQQPTLGIHRDVSFSTFHLLAAVEAPRPPFSVVLDDWLSIITTLGSASRPAFRRTCSRNWSLIRCHVPSRIRLRKYVCTVDQGGKSWGSIRQEQPVRSTYKIPLIYSRAFSGSVRFRGSKTCRYSHSFSVKSVGYRSRWLIPSILSRNLFLYTHFLRTSEPKPTNC